MAGTRRLSELVASALPRLVLPPGNLVVSLSGGGDSAALAFLVGEAGRDVRAVHVDHGLPASPLMRGSAMAVASRLDIAIEVVSVEVPPGASPEGRARVARYGALSRAAGSSESLLTGHTADDNVETVIMNLVRGTATRGLAGIPPYRPPNIHRPMLGISRSLAREVAMLAGLPFVEDPMNLDPALTRNWIRASVIPLLTALNPDLAGAVTRMSALVRADADLLDSMGAAVRVSGRTEESLVAVGALLALPGPVAARVVLGMLERAGTPATAEQVEKVMAVAHGDVASAQLAAGVGVLWRGPFLVVSSRSRPGGRTVPLPIGETRYSGLVFEVARHEMVCRVAPLSQWHAVFPANTVLEVGPAGEVSADGEPAWMPGVKRLPVAWYRPGTVGYLSVLAREDSGWTSSL